MFGSPLIALGCVFVIHAGLSAHVTLSCPVVFIFTTSADRVLWQSSVWTQSALDHQEQTLSPTKENPYLDSKQMNRLRREAEDRNQTNSLITTNE